jgi:hypothetical protein
VAGSLFDELGYYETIGIPPPPDLLLNIAGLPLFDALAADLFPGATYARRPDLSPTVSLPVSSTLAPAAIQASIEAALAPVRSSPLEPEPEPTPVGILSDIGQAVGIGGGFLGGDVNTGGGILDVITGGIEEVFRRQTTTAEERVLSGDYYPGDIERAIGNIEGKISQAERVIQPIYNYATGGNIPVADVVSLFGNSVGVAPCPTSGGMGFPAGSCITVNDWQALGMPKGFEVAGVSQGGTLILRKKRRRRRRTGLTKGMMGDIEFLKGVGNSSAVRSYLTRVLR